ncbi:PAS domain S-box protein [Denitromonas iodatirespirans]|uniref:histidine kinase n=1 Tax=Denitromonas iodatirespirans TaxID=2795389 RepID=A0A944H9H6_DENI1|nr:PAS domain S-box protein [Denitromonas iodatirespirans]MBT0963428.1 PAS domain S-box protein [Denitromonas iodatirespirans]
MKTSVSSYPVIALGLAWGLWLIAQFVAPGTMAWALVPALASVWAVRAARRQAPTVDTPAPPDHTDAPTDNKRPPSPDTLARDVEEALACRGHILYRLDLKRQAYDYISPVIGNLIGHAPSSLIEDGGWVHLRSRIPPGDTELIRERTRQALEASPAGPCDIELEYRIQDARGQMRWLRDSVRLMRDDAGRVCHTTGAAIEITETKAAEERLRVTLRAIGDAVMATDTAGRITLFNPGAATLTGWQEDEALGRPIDEVLVFAPNADKHPVALPIDAVLKTGTAMRSPEAMILIDRHGQRIPVLDSTAPIQMAGDPAPLGAVIVLHDERASSESLRRLNESEARYRTLVESSPVGIFHFDRKQHITFVNTRFSDILERPHEQLVGLDLHTLADAAVLPAVRAALEGHQGRYEGPYHDPQSGREIRFSIRTAPVFDAAGEVVGGVGIVEDNTAKYDAERKLRESETRYALAMRGTNEGLWDWNPLTMELFLSSRLMALLGEAAESLRTTSDAWLARMHPDDRDVYYLRMVAHLKGETQHFELEFRMATHDGSYRWFRSRGIAQRDESGNAYRMVGSMGDITARKRAEMQLTNELAFSRTLVDSLPVGLCVARRDGSLTLLNPYFSRLTGHTADDLDRLSVADLIIAEDRPVILQRLERAFDEGAAWAETQVEARDGRRLPVSFLARRVTLHDIDQLLCIATDISERKNAELQMRNLNRELEIRVTDRTAQLAAAVKELETFSYSVSHDLRSPLRAIDGYARIIRDDYHEAFTPEAHKLFERMLAAVSRMSELIDDLLELSRVSRRPLNRKSIDLSHMAGQVVGALAQNQPQRQVEVHIAPDMTVFADAKLLQIAVENLLGNAWKFTAKRPQAEIRFFTAKAGPETVFCVEDNGAGFDMRYADKLFGPFQRLHTDRDFEGTGIGLATVSRIIQRHGGRVWAEGEIDRGARFYFTLGSIDK